jgi:hypothetical protein
MVSDAPLKQGDVVKIHNWHGVVLETHFDESGALSVIRVQTARNLFRGYGPEYIDVRLDPEAVSLAALADLEQEIETHRRLLDNALQRLLEDVTQHSKAASVLDS